MENILVGVVVAIAMADLIRRSFGRVMILKVSQKLLDRGRVKWAMRIRALGRR